MNITADTALKECREAYERWINTSKGYGLAFAEECWDVSWQAALNARSAPASAQDVERVAIAISPWRAGKDRRHYSDFCWEKLLPHVQDAYREQAKAALAAINMDVCLNGDISLEGTAKSIPCESEAAAIYEPGIVGIGNKWLRNNMEDAVTREDTWVGAAELDKAVAHLASLGNSKCDSHWCYLHPQEAAALIDRLNAEIVKRPKRDPHSELSIRSANVEQSLDAMTSNARIKIFSKYCIHCGDKDPGCRCWDDE